MILSIRMSSTSVTHNSAEIWFINQYIAHFDDIEGGYSSTELYALK